MADIILFDLDGTLSDPKMGITKSVQYALKKLGRTAPDNDTLTVFIGPPLLEMFMEYAEMTRDEAELAVRFYRERFGVYGMFENILYPGIPKMLETLCSAGKQLVLATSKPLFFAEQIIEYFGISKYFTLLMGSELDGRRTKKADVIEEALRQLELPRDKWADVLMVGDRCHDIEGARTHGLGSIGVLFGYGSAEELTAAGADQLAGSVEELTALLLS